MHLSRRTLLKPLPKPFRTPRMLLHASTKFQRATPPTADGSELVQPLEPADVRAFWSNHKQEAAKIARTPTVTSQLDASAMRELLSTIIEQRTNKGAVTMGVSTQRFCEVYEGLDDDGKLQTLKLLAVEFCATKGNAQQAARAYLAKCEATDDPAQHASEARALRDDLTPKYSELFDQINRLPGGFAFLVHLRSDMLKHAKKDPSVRAMSDVLMRRLETWIIGTLDLKRITWGSPAYTIEKLGEYEAVHAVKSWLDVKRRLGNGRRCFGFFHRSVPLEPLVFVWVALTDQISSNVQSILTEPESKPDESSARCAIFYSINSQPGLSGVDLGNFLIKRVVGVLQSEFPNLDTFCTLSPLPRFRAWLEQWLTPERLATPPANIAITQPEQDALIALVPGTTTWTQALKHTSESRGWTSNSQILATMEPVVRALGAHYLVNEKRGKSAFDPVANFHLRNGACLHRVNWRGNTAYSGLRQSLGLMCNYNYVLDRVEDNNDRYVRFGEIAVSGDDKYVQAARAAVTKPKL